MRSFPVPSTIPSEPQHMTGRVHSCESFGTVDGPGIRYVVFLQGCPMRCLYCHNPDTWDVHGGKLCTVDEILQAYQKNRPFYETGGITVTGGEPLLQLDFITALFTAAKQQGIHTCIDTSGAVFRPEDTTQQAKLDALMAATDLVMLDLKQTDPLQHHRLTGMENQNILAFAEYLAEKKIPLWVRRVVVPDLTDDPKELEQLGRFIGKLRNLKALDVIPYHTMGVVKYKELGIAYPLEGIPPLTQQAAMEAKEHILRGINCVRKGK